MTEDQTAELSGYTLVDLMPMADDTFLDKAAIGIMQTCAAALLGPIIDHCIGSGEDLNFVIPVERLNKLTEALGETSYKFAMGLLAHREESRKLWQQFQQKQQP